MKLRLPDNPTEANLVVIEQYLKAAKKKVKKLDWGLRKNRELIKNPQNIKLELLNEELRIVDYKQVR